MDDERWKQEWLREAEEKRDKEKKSHLGRGSWRNDDREIDADKATAGPVRYFSNRRPRTETGRCNGPATLIGL